MQSSGHGHAGALAADGSQMFPWRAGRDLSFARGLNLSPAVAALLMEPEATAASSGRDESMASQSSDALPPAVDEAPGLVMSRSSSCSVSSTAPAATSIPPHAQLAKSVGERDTGISCLTLRGCRATEAGLRALFAGTARSARSLTTLDVSDCRGVSLAFLAALPYGSPLAVVRADGCAGVRHVSATLPERSMLHELSVRRCPNLVSVVLAAPALQECSVSQSMKLERVTLAAPRLQRMRAVHCRNVTVLQMGSVPRLEELNLMGASKLPGTDISTVMAASPLLQTCSLVDCRLLASLIVPGTFTAPSCERN